MGESRSAIPAAVGAAADALSLSAIAFGAGEGGYASVSARRTRLDEAIVLSNDAIVREVEARLRESPPVPGAEPPWLMEERARRTRGWLASSDVESGDACRRRDAQVADAISAILDAHPVGDDREALRGLALSLRGGGGPSP
jgi:hypothetical protein